MIVKKQIVIMAKENNTYLKVRSTGWVPTDCGRFHIKGIALTTQGRYKVARSKSI